MSGRNNNSGWRDNSGWGNNSGRGWESSQHPNHYGPASEHNDRAGRPNPYYSFNQNTGPNTSSRQGYPANRTNPSPIGQRNFPLMQQPMHQPPPAQAPAAGQATATSAGRSNSYNSYDQNTGPNTSSGRGYSADSIPRKKRDEKQWWKTGQNRINPSPIGQRDVPLMQQTMNQPPPVQMPAAEQATATPMEVSRSRPKKFSEMTWREKIEHQFLQYEQHSSHHSRGWDDIPQEYQKEDTSYWIEKKKRASEIAYQKTIEEMNKMNKKKPIYSEEDSDSMSDFSDDYDGPYGKRRKKESEFDLSQKEIKDFMEALQSNVIFDMGFRVNGFIAQDEENCWCPCGPRMEPWRKLFNLEAFAGKGTAAFCSTGKSGKKMTPQGLMTHIKSKLDCFLHFGINEYLHVVHGDLYGKIGHKGLYQIGDDNYKAAEAAEKKSKHRMILLIRKERDEALNEAERLKQEKEQHEEDLYELNKVNEDLRKKVEQLEKTKKALEVEGKKEDTQISESEIDNYRRSYDGFFKNLKTLKNVVEKIDTKPIKIKVKQNFDLSELFKELNEKKNKDNSYLFRDLDKKSKGKKDGGLETFAYKLIMKWEIQYASYATGEDYGYDENGKRINLDKAADEGGPTREFFSQTWKQMDCLKISYQFGRETIVVPLFERTPAGVIPYKDEQIRNVPEEVREDIVDEAKRYYRAIGRIMFHSLVTNHPISSEAMPSFFRNIIFRACKLQDYKYREDIVDHLAEIGQKIEHLEQMIGSSFNDILCNNSDEIITKENIFTKVIPEQFVESRSIALKSITEGLTLSVAKDKSELAKDKSELAKDKSELFDVRGLVDVPGLFSIMPLHVVSILAFPKPSILADDLIKILQPDYSEGTDDFIEDQKVFFGEILPDVLKNREKIMRDNDETRCENKKEDDFLRKFVHFCTGLFFIPHPKAQPKFKITIEFDSVEMLPDSLPVAHTCDRIFKIPASVYDKNRETFEQKLDQSIEACENIFGMR